MACLARVLSCKDKHMHIHWHSTPAHGYPKERGATLGPVKLSRTLLSPGSEIPAVSWFQLWWFQPQKPMNDIVECCET